MNKTKPTYEQKNGPICFSSKVDVEPPSQANGNAMVLRDVRIVEEGEAKGHDVWIDASFVHRTVELAQGRRIKCRFGHPGMCKESFGTQLGYYDNFRVMSDSNGTYAVADLHLLEAANQSPNGKLAEYIQALAKEAPDMFGNSIVFSYSKCYYKTDKGVNVSQDGSQWVTDEGAIYEEEKHGVIDDAKPYTDMTAFRASDLVDEPAATSALFSSGDDLITRFLEKLGFTFAAKKKAIMFKQLIKEFTDMAKKQMSINATVADGSSIVVETDNDYIGVGDSVTDTEGNAVQDGSYDITESDSNQSGITITTNGGTITRIEPTPASEQEQADSAPNTQGLSELQKKVRELTSDVEALKAQVAKHPNKAQFEALSKRVEVVEAQPVAQPTVVVAGQKQTIGGKNGTGNSYGWTL